MDFNPAIFRAYDIRGRVGEEINGKFSEALGKAYGTFIQENGNSGISVGWDTRFTSESIASNFIHGVLSTGCDVFSIGIVPTPCLYFSIYHLELEGGVMITGSHNDAGVNGFKLCGRQAYPIFGKKMERLKVLVKEEKFRQGEGVFKAEKTILELYKDDLVSRINIERPVKLVIDCGNGTSSTVAQDVFSKVGCRVDPLYCEIRGSFWEHNPDPAVPANLKDLAIQVRKSGAELGIAFDSDGDRMGIVDERGIFYEADRVLLLLAQDLLKRYPDHRVLFDVKASYTLDALIRKYGGIPVLFKTGRSGFRRAMVENPNIILGGELSGHFFIADNHYGYDDGIFSALRVVEIVSRTDKKFSHLFKDVPRTFHTSELMPSCPDSSKFRIVEELAQEFRRDYQTVEIDGVRILFDPTSWALVRAKNTTPALSLRFEAGSGERLEQIIDIVHQALSKYNEVSDVWYQQALNKIEERYKDHF